MDKICRNCTYFVPGEDMNDHSCENDKFVYSGEEGLSEKDQLGYWDYESYSAGFNVGEEFGCIHFHHK